MKSNKMNSCLVVEKFPRSLCKRKSLLTWLENLAKEVHNLQINTADNYSSISLISNLILFSRLSVRLPSGILRCVFPTAIL